MNAPATWTSRSITPQEAAILFHPDQRTPWAPSLVVHLQDALALELAQARLDALAVAHPILDARLDGSRWIAGSGRLAIERCASPVDVLRTRFDLSSRPPLRTALSLSGHALVVVGHHAALDGRALVAVASALLGVPDAIARGTADARDPNLGAGVSASGGGAAAAARRVLSPADRVAASSRAPDAESFRSADPGDAPAPRASRLAAAAVAAVAGWNAERVAPWRRIGLTIPVGGPPVLGNVSTHRRVDLQLPADVPAAVTAALAEAAEPPGAGLTPERARLLRMLAPVTNRLSDSLLISNLGRVELPGAAHVEFFPQARGRSAVAIGACTPVGGRPRVTLRARDLDEHDAEELLARIVAQLGAEPA